MASLNKVYLLGNLTRDPDLRSLPSGQSVCELGLAVGRRYVNSNGQEVEDTCFVDVVVWGRSAANCKQYLEKGSQVLVEGRLQLDQWEDRNGGGKRSKLRVVAEQIQFMNRRSDGGNAGGGAPAYGNGGGNSYGGGAPAYGNGGGNYGAPQQQGGYSRPSMPRQPMPQAAPGGMPRQQQPMPPMPPEGAFNPDEGMEDDIPF